MYEHCCSNSMATVRDKSARAWVECTMSTLKFDGTSHKIELLDSQGSSKGAWVAYNNIDRAFAKEHYDSLTHLLNGSYDIIDQKQPHSHKADANGPYGLHGIIRFTYPHHSGV